MAEMVTEEAKLLSEALSTVKIQVQQMKRHLVCLPIAITPPSKYTSNYMAGVRPANGRA
jgi:hypothetical protein